MSELTMDKLVAFLKSNNKIETVDKKDECSCGKDHCHCDDDCQCGDECDCGDDCNCGDDCHCGEHCHCHDKED